MKSSIEKITQNEFLLGFCTVEQILYLKNSKKLHDFIYYNKISKKKSYIEKQNK
ncbi:MAG TPA: hypothetical protein V6C58_14265 [Allocoleopsis sp.]